jgi:hypothetical protein
MGLCAHDPGILRRFVVLGLPVPSVGNLLTQPLQRHLLAALDLGDEMLLYRGGYP